MQKSFGILFIHPAQKVKQSKTNDGESSCSKRPNVGRKAVEE